MALSFCSPLALTTTHSSSSLPTRILHSHSLLTPLTHFPSFSTNKTPTAVTQLQTPLTYDQKWRVSISFFSSLLTKKGKDATALKEELLQAIAPLDRGAKATSEDEQRVDQVGSLLKYIYIYILIFNYYYFEYFCYYYFQFFFFNF